MDSPHDADNGITENSFNPDNQLPMNVTLAGILGLFIAVIPAIVYKYDVFKSSGSPLWPIVFVVIWASIIGHLGAWCWHKTLHLHQEKIKKHLDEKNELIWRDRQNPPKRFAFFPSWIGGFERIFYCLLIGFSVPGTGAFIGAWIMVKIAGGWQAWSKGSTYGRTVLFTGVLGNAMSLLIGLIAGLVVKMLLAAS